MSFKKVKKEFSVWLTEEWNGYWEGSHLHVEKESKTLYYGMASINACSFYVKFPKAKCTKVSPMDEIMNSVEKFFKTPEGKKSAEKMQKILNKN